MTAVRMTFEDFKLVKTRKQAQFILECPIEQADIALEALGGLPVSGQDRWVGVARLKDDLAPERPQKGGPLSQEAGRLCGDPTFWAFLATTYPTDWNSNLHDNRNERSAWIVRQYCAVSSRSELDHDGIAAEAWKALREAYYDSQRGQSPEQQEQQMRRT